MKVVGEPETVTEAFSYLFTKFEDPNRIPHLLHAKLQHLTKAEGSDLPLVLLLRDMAAKAQEGGMALNLMSPHPPTAAAVLDWLSRRPATDDPATVFQDRVAPDPLAKLQQQLERQRRSVSTALARGDIPVLRYRVLQLSALRRELRMAETSGSYQECLVDVERSPSRPPRCSCTPAPWAWASKAILIWAICGAQTFGLHPCPPRAPSGR